MSVLLMTKKERFISAARNVPWGTLEGFAAGGITNSRVVIENIFEDWWRE
ncbi:MAG TPA: hypothetical protein VIH61_02835 [Waddliaceae bacterium]